VSAYLSAFVNESTSLENWHRKARGLPTTEEEGTLRNELAVLLRQQQQELEAYNKAQRDRRAQLEKQAVDLVKQSYIGGFIPLGLQTPNVSLKKGENVLWESGATKLKQRSSKGLLYWDTDKSGTLIVTNQRIIFCTSYSLVWTHNLSKVVNVAQENAGGLQVVTVWLDALQKPVGFHVSDVQASATVDSRTFQFNLNAGDLREIIRIHV
jgi:hypothetical protein